MAAWAGLLKIAACLGVKDEALLIEPAIRHLRAIGVDHIIACDMNSTDGSYEIMDRHRSENFWLFRMSDAGEGGFDETWTRVNVALAKSSGADWVLSLDADEFCIPRDGSLRNCAALAGADVLVIDRFNVPCGPERAWIPEHLDPAHYDDLLLLAQPVDDPRAYLERNPTAPIALGKLDPKPMFRPDRIISLEPGGHDVIPGDAEPLRRRRPTDLLIAHLPFTTRSRFLRKVDNVINSLGVAVTADDEALAWHWRRWVTLADQGRLDEEFDRNVWDQAAIAEWRAQGIIRSAAELFQDGNL